MDDNEILGRTDYIQLMLWIALMAVPVGLLTLIYLAFYYLQAHAWYGKPSPIH